MSTVCCGWRRMRGRQRRTGREGREERERERERAGDRERETVKKNRRSSLLAFCPSLSLSFAFSLPRRAFPSLPPSLLRQRRKQAHLGEQGVEEEDFLGSQREIAHREAKLRPLGRCAPPRGQGPAREGGGRPPGQRPVRARCPPAALQKGARVSLLWFFSRCFTALGGSASPLPSYCCPRARALPRCRLQ